ncbi:MAG: hypothetical protein KOO69_08595 [Victivallales bacterium]|nr:hypothetical protein [Victivallales bacterium]
MLHRKIKKKWLEILIYVSLFLFISWILTASIGIKAVKKEHEAFLQFFYKKCKERYKKDPTIALTWTTPQMGVSARRASFWRRKLFQEKQYPTFEEWKKFHKKRNTISYFALCPFLIESKRYNGNIAWMQEYYFWYFWRTRKYKHKILVYID